MPRLIDANAIPYEEHYVPDGDTQWEYKKELCVLKPTVDAMPTVDAVEVVHGRWEHIKDYGGGNCFGYCSHCKTPIRANSLMALEMDNRYCRWCGAKMDGERKDNESI